jgi:hypothetical protein
MDLLERLSKANHPFDHTIHGRLVNALSHIKGHYEAEGWELRQSDIRRFGEEGIPLMNTRNGEIRCTKDGCHRRIFFRIHRSPSNAYFIDQCEMR